MLFLGLLHYWLSLPFSHDREEKNTFLSFCLHTKVRLYLQIKIQKLNLYSESIHPSFIQIMLTFVIPSCHAVFWHQVGT